MNEGKNQLISGSLCVECFTRACRWRVFSERNGQDSRMTHPTLGSPLIQPCSNDWAPTVIQPLVRSLSRSTSLSVDPIFLHCVCPASRSSLSTRHHLNLAATPPSLPPSVPQTHRLGSDFQITLGERSGCRSRGNNWSECNGNHFGKKLLNVHDLFLC